MELVVLHELGAHKELQWYQYICRREINFTFTEVCI